MTTQTAILSNALTAASMGDHVALMSGFTSPVIFKVIGICKDSFGGYLRVECLEDGPNYEVGEIESVQKFLNPETRTTVNGSPTGWLYLGQEIPAEFI